jgi:hypothetical protein
VDIRGDSTLKSEAVLTSRIEGTQASLVDLYAFEVETS